MVNKQTDENPPTRASVQEAIQALHASGQRISVRTVNRWLRSVPPWRGLRWARLLPLLQHPHLSAQECYAGVLAMTASLQAERSHPSERLPALLLRARTIERTCLPRLLAASVAVDGPSASVIWPHEARYFQRQVLAVTKAVGA